MTMTLGDRLACFPELTPNRLSESGHFLSFLKEMKDGTEAFFNGADHQDAARGRGPSEPGQTIGSICKGFGISEQSYYRRGALWRSEAGPGQAANRPGAFDTALAALCAR
jgi:hypothetical protein